jgi:hypothetical protein
MFDDDPGVYNDADILQAQYEAESAAAAADVRRGICHHGWTLGGGRDFYSADDIAAMRLKGHFPDRPTDPRVTDQRSIPEGLELCTDCGALIVDRWT